MRKIISDRIENIVVKGENAGYQHFLLFPQCFQKASFPGLLNHVIVFVNGRRQHLPFVPSVLFGAAEIAHHIVDSVSTVNAGLVKGKDVGGKHRCDFSSFAARITDIPGAVHKSLLEIWRSFSI